MGIEKRFKKIPSFAASIEKLKFQESVREFEATQTIQCHYRYQTSSHLRYRITINDSETARS